MNHVMMSLKILLRSSFEITLWALNHYTQVYNFDVVIKLLCKGKCLTTLITNKRLLHMIMQLMNFEVCSCKACVVTLVTFELLHLGFVIITHVGIIHTQCLEIFSAFYT